MKFSEYVGHDKAEKLKKIVQTSIGPTEEEFLRKVARENPDSSKINKKEFYFGFGISKKALKRTHDYIKSWFLRYHIPFTSINPYLTLYVLRNIPNDKRDFIGDVKEAKRDMIFSPEDDGYITILKDKENIELRLEYDINKNMEARLISILERKDIEIVKDGCYVSLFKIGKMIDEKFLENMMYSCPKFPDIRLGHIGILRRK